ncbi:MAG: radical SAM protein [Mogibacterium sp.]|nr:radical SAM protein [Mogibacterium sp.]
MITLQRPDPKVSAMLGKNKGINEGDVIRPSIFAIPLALGKRKVVLNTFTCHCIETENYSWFEEPGKLVYDEGDAEMKELIANDYLVRDDFDEIKKYTGLLPILRRMEKPKPGYMGYTILPTTCCNARCAYCYEEGLEYETMSDEVLKQTIRYIHATRREGSTVHLHWFGGEPLLGEKHIDRISEAMRDAGVEYTSNIVSNGSLMTEEMAAKAKKEWHLNSIQITLDGREEVYCERKRYKNFEGSPCRAVLRGIHALLDQNIRVSIRLNVDEENLDELMLLADELEHEFEKESLISIYCHGIFAEEGDDPNRDNDRLYSGMEKLSDRLEEFNRNRRENYKTPDEVSQEPIDDSNIQWETPEDRCPEDEETKEEKERKEGARRYYNRQGFLRRHYCMVDEPTAGPVILPNGKFNLCEHIGELPVVGTVFDETPINREKFIERNRSEMEKCRTCGLFPVCTDFTGCPTIPRDCYKETLAKEKGKLRALENEDRLPPVNIKKDDRIIRVTEPTKEFIKANRDIIVPSYHKANETMDCDAAKALLSE